jgi:hypothetical protein
MSNMRWSFSDSHTRIEVRIFSQLSGTDQIFFLATSG